MAIFYLITAASLASRPQRVPPNFKVTARFRYFALGGYNRAHEGRGKQVSLAFRRCVGGDRRPARLAGWLEQLPGAVAVTRYEPQTQKRLFVDVTVGGTTISQQFSFVDYLWSFDLLVNYTPTDYGSYDDLAAAYAKPYVDFTDHYGTEHEVFMLGSLAPKPLSPAIDGVASFTVPVTLRKRQA